MGAAGAVVLVVCLACKGGRGGADGGGASATASSAPSAPACTERAGDVHGSLHAEVAYGTTFDPPKAKHKQAYDCGAKTAVALQLDYATAADASNACNFVGPQLWGGNAPTARDPDELLTKGASIAIVSGAAIDELSAMLEADGWRRWRVGAGGGSGGGTAAPTLDVVKELPSAVDCKSGKDALRMWCPVASLSTSGFTLPPVATTYVGVTVAAKNSAPLKTSLRGAPSVSALTIGPGRIKVSSITPDNAKERAALAATASIISRALEGSGKGTISVGKDLASFLDGLKSDLSTKGLEVSSSTGKPATFKATNPSEVALVRGAVDAYVVLEHATDGTWVNVFPTRPYGP